MRSLLEAPPPRVTVQAPNHFGREKQSFLVHAPSKAGLRNAARFESLELGSERIFRCQLSLPKQAPDVFFGLRVYGSGDQTRFERSLLLTAGQTREWGVDLSEAPSCCDLELWTELSPNAAGNGYGWARFINPHLLSATERWARDDERTRLVAELDAKYEGADPWQYQNSGDDEVRRSRLLGALPSRRYGRTLDIGCGDGYVTFELPGLKVVGTDLSNRAIHFARQRADTRADSERFDFEALDALDADAAATLGSFDLIVVTGVLYPQYIGRSWAQIRVALDRLLVSGGILAMCHIQEWTRQPITYPRLRQSWYAYKGYTHALEVFVK